MCLESECFPFIRHLLLLLVLSLFCAPVIATEHACPVALSSGQPACADSRDAGSSTPDPTRSRHVANPVDVVSGNKYQSELDVRLGGSHLSLVRHYNSVNADQNVGLGNGWRHTFSVILITDGDSIRRIIQSDGRSVEFRQQSSLYQSPDGNDGYLQMQSDNKHTWHIPDGRVLSFNGSFLTRISFGDGSALSLFYQRSRLHSVTDDLGRSIFFRYAPGRLGLPSYEPTENNKPAGHLTAIELPDGSQIQYLYDHRQNLVSVAYPRYRTRKEGFVYRYEDVANSSLLTTRADRYGRTMGRWSYDDSGRVVTYYKGSRIRADGSERGAPDVALTYAAGSDASSGITTVVSRDGTRTEFQWSIDASRRVKEVYENGVEPMLSNGRISQNQFDDVSRVESQTDPLTSSDTLTILEVNKLGYPSRIQYQSAVEIEPNQLTVIYSQLGTLVDVRWESGLIRDVESDRPITRQELTDFINTHWGKGDRMPAILSASAQRGFIETSAKRLLIDTNQTLEVGTVIRGVDLIQSASNRVDVPRPDRRSKDSSQVGSVACQNLLEDCDDLLEARDFAELSDCAYANSLCATGFVEADFEKLGVQGIDLVDGSFRAEIFYDKHNDEYIVTFAGTKISSFGDWINNAQQELGKESYQYESAVRLAKKLVRLNPDIKFRFTGHSLGGGLATAAAAVTGREAIVFNPAALNPQTAINHNFAYTAAESYTHSYVVTGELLDQLQTGLEFSQEVQGAIHSLPRPEFAWIQANVWQNPLWAYNTRLGVTLHEIAAVKQSLAELIERHQCE